MKKIISTPARLAALALTALLASTCAIADKGDKDGKHGHGNKHEKRDDAKRHDDRRYDDRRDDVSIQVYFGNNDRRIVNEYYAPEFRAGHCPPGLAKKGNGCMPPGQAKKWARGRPLPHDLVVYDLPPDLRYRLPPPPAGHRYVQLGADVLMIAIGTSMVVDAIEDMVR